jgi:dUTP pyrophosphatase
MGMISIKIINSSKHGLPEYSTGKSAGMDLRANLDRSICIKPLERLLVGTGLFIELPEGYEAQVRPRSGLAIKHGISILNTPGTIDADYRGEIGIILVNLSNEEFIINDGDRVGQLIISKHETVSWIPVETLEITDRGTRGFGHTGHK